jgi:hypothetical protein
MCQRNLGIQNAVCHRNLESCNTKYGNVSDELRMQFVTGIWRDVIRNTVMCQRNFGIQNTFFRRNLERCITKCGNMAEEFRNTERSSSHDFLRAVMRNTIMCQRNLRIKNAVCHRNLENRNPKYGNVRGL